MELAPSPAEIRGAWLESSHPVAFTGAGISVASGLPTLAGSWHGVGLARLLDRDFFRRDPEGFYRFFREEMLRWTAARPNPAHLALARTGMPVITQNLDGLHQKAGSREVLEINGNLRELYCPPCTRRYPIREVWSGEGLPACPYCLRILEPNLVMDGDPMPKWEEAAELAARADLLLVIGSGLDVAPADRLPAIVEATGGRVLLINDRAETVLPAAFC